MIRIAQQGWAFSKGAETAEDVNVGVGCWWVEIDGVRLERIVRAEVIAAEGEVTLPRLVIDLAAAVEIVYVDARGEPLPGSAVATSPEALAAVGPLEDGIVVRREDL